MSGTELRLLVVGDENAGKTSLVMVLNGKPFPTRYVPLIFDEYTHTEHVGRVPHTLRVVDTVDNRGVLSFHGHCYAIPYREPNAILLCFALDSRHQFENLNDRWIGEIRHYCPDVKIILVGLRSDLREPANPRHVTDEEVRVFQIQHQCEAFITCSAKSGEGLDEIFPAALDACSAEPNGDRSCLLL
jgi:small GTP-binding protein